ncbi:hypothetical protein MNEG_10947, partial [Monoraphidium neglectum]
MVPASPGWVAFDFGEYQPPQQWCRPAMRRSMQSSRHEAFALHGSSVSDSSRPTTGAQQTNTPSSCPPSTSGSRMPHRASFGSKSQSRCGAWMAAQPVWSTAPCQEEIAVEAPLGRGGYGAVYRGYWRHKTPAAIKVMHTHNNEQEAVAHAFEMAVLSSVQHPNIVQAYSCLTDMIDVDALDDASEAVDGSSACGAESDDDASSVASIWSTTRAAAPAPAAGRFRRLAPGERVPASCLVNILVMELCDRGSLRDALDRGALRCGGPAAPVDPAAAGQVLLDVASALKYLHCMRLVHGDIRVRRAGARV